jgi:hypothetical protein
MVVTFILLAGGGFLYSQTERIVIDGFQLEWMGGISLGGPGDLNLLVQYDKALQDLEYDQYIQYQQDAGWITGWQKTTDGGRGEITHGIPFGLRVRYNLNERIAFSLGVHYLTLGRSREFTHEYDLEYGTYPNRSYRLTHSPYRVTANGFSPLAGIHYKHKFTDTLGVEGYFTLGPVVANCKYEDVQLFEWLYKGSGDPYVLWDQKRELKELGTGTGIAINAGARLNVALHPKWDIFVEAGYHFRMITRLTGLGYQEIDSFAQSWNGRWILVEETITTDWGEITRRFPTNASEDWPDEQVVGDFSLNLSGFQISVGLSFKFKVIIEPRY